MSVRVIAVKNQGNDAISAFYIKSGDFFKNATSCFTPRGSGVQVSHRPPYSPSAFQGFPSYPQNSICCVYAAFKCNYDYLNCSKTLSGPDVQLEGLCSK
ncbi:hypothetical protein REIS_1801 [Rickettsia endosymbiont of Ixodes scapularis]|nr:hypothetical protein REIS_1801 [Rickettsia endosymbiont of Ixodes scapularis]